MSNAETEATPQQPVQPIVPSPVEFSEDARPPNWSAVDAFNDACRLVDDALGCIEKHNSLLVDALIRTARLIEHWRGEHRREIETYLGAHDLKDEVLAIVKCVFHRQSKSQWTWHANALRQAFADGRASDDMTMYFQDKNPTQRADQWRKARQDEIAAARAARINTAAAAARAPSPEEIAAPAAEEAAKYRYETIHVDKLSNVPRKADAFEITVTVQRCKDGGFDLLVPVGTAPRRGTGKKPRV